MIKRLVAGGAVLAIGAGVWGIAGEDHTTRDDSGTIIEAGQLGAFVTQLGDCFESLPNEELITTVPGVSCNSAHHWQVFYKGDLSLSFFDSTEVENATSELCSSALNRIADELSYEKVDEYQNASMAWLNPTAESWDKEDRTVDCLVGSDDEYFYSSFISD
jgi:uncharacterized protein YecA (UPF0149 family)